MPSPLFSLLLLLFLILSPTGGGAGGTSPPPLNTRTAVFAIDYYENTISGEMRDRAEAFLAYARARGAAVFHLCYECYVPRTGNDDFFLRSAARAVPRCAIPEICADERSDRFSSDERVHTRLWPFREVPPKGVPLHEGCALLAEGRIKFRYGWGPGCEAFPGERAPPGRDNSIRDRINNPQRSALDTRHPDDIITEDSDWIWRALSRLGIQNIVFFGADANECLLYARPCSILGMRARGWRPENMFAVPQLSSTKYRVQGVRIDWERAGTYLWAAALRQNFGIRSIRLKFDVLGKLDSIDWHDDNP